MIIREFHHVWLNDEHHHYYSKQSGIGSGGIKAFLMLPPMTVQWVFRMRELVGTQAFAWVNGSGIT